MNTQSPNSQVFSDFLGTSEMPDTSNQNGTMALKAEIIQRHHSTINPGLCIHQLVEKQVYKNPEAMAVRYNNQTLTYGELDARANTIAAELQKLGVTSNTLVAIYVERSIEMITSILGVLKSGGAYVPIDPHYPRERIDFILKDSSAGIIITSRSLGHNIHRKKETLLYIEEFAKHSSTKASTRASTSKPDDLAYIIYTSGSSGEPKGVLVSHRNVVRLFSSTEQWFRFNDSDVWIQFHSFAFDFSVWEIWGALFYGGKLIVPEYSVTRNPDELLKLVSKEAVTVLNQTPSAFKQFMKAEEDYKNQPLALRYIIFGGEMLNIQSLASWYEKHDENHPRLVNMYGITETTVHTTYRELKKSDLADSCRSPIGIPLPDLTIQLLDQNGKPTPVGEIGEIHVGGAGVTHGYLNRPELTEARFIENPFGRPGDKLYRSGDLARQLKNGEYEYVGRSDNQVKLRGFRIELGEIEAQLLRNPAIAQAFVLCEEASEGEKEIIAYLRNKKPVTNLDLRRFLEQKLPPYMIPSKFILINEFPLTEHGKIDRNRLPRPSLTNQVAPGNETTLPSTRDEHTLVQIWSKVLGVQMVGVSDNFFDLGGDSIKSIRIVSEAKKAGMPISLQDLLECKDIRTLSKRLNSSVAGVLETRELKPFQLLTTKPSFDLDEVEDAYPVTKLQEGMIFHSEYNQKSAVYHDVFSFLIQLKFDPNSLYKTLEDLCLKHEVFRTSIETEKYSEVLQVVHRKPSVPLTIQNLSALDSNGQHQELVKWISEEKYNAFHWNQYPLARFHVQILSENAFQFIVSFHHAILDGWSLAAFVTELFKNYTDLLENRPSKIQQLSNHYRDYVSLEQTAIRSKTSQDFWTKYLEDAEYQPLPRWPRRFRKGGTEQSRGPEVIFSAETLQNLNNLSKELSVPLRTCLLAAHFRVLRSLHNRDDIISGLISNGRPEEIDGDKMIGLFLNALPIRVNLNGESSWKVLIRQIFEIEQKTLPHRRFPLSDIHKLTGKSKLFETAFDFVHFHVYKDLTGYKGIGFLEGEYFEANNFTLLTTFMLSTDSTRLQMHFDYDPEELTESQIVDMGKYYFNAINEMAAHPGKSFSKISILPDNELKRMVWEWNSTNQPFGDARHVQKLFERQYLKNPEQTAVTDGRINYTYREIEQRANRLANIIRKKGIAPQTLIPVFLSRNSDLIWILLGILKAQCAYVPIDPSQPYPRIQKILNAIKSPILISNLMDEPIVQKSVEENWDCLHYMINVGNPNIPNWQRSTSRIINLNSIEKESSEHPGNKGSSSSADTAYIIFTSGSTGQPKGVEISHEAVINLIEWVNKAYRVGKTDRLLFVTSLSFDLSVYDIFGILAAGGTIRIATRDETKDPEKLVRILEEDNITFWDSAPATLQQVVPFLPLKGVGSLRLVFLSGDWIPLKLPQQVRKTYPNAHVVGLGGATEATIWSNSFDIHQIDPEWRSIPYGKPIQNCRYYILDKELQPCPVGVTGNLYISGVCLAKGYFDDEKLTHERFIPNPFVPGERLYWTGDQARYFPDGNIEFMGRIDQQVKIRGYRIELGEIESAINQCSQVLTSTVIAEKPNGSTEQLLAYVIFKSKKTVNEDCVSLRARLQKLLPPYMIPNRIIPLDSLPLTSNGKLDRNALPSPSRTGLSEVLKSPYPLSKTQEQLCSIWSSVLGKQHIRMDDNFFELGGHSLNATQIIARTKKAFNIQIPLKSIFESPSIASFSKVVDTQLDSKEKDLTPVS